MIQIPIRDSGFKHAFGISWYHKPSYFEWSREKVPNQNELLWFTDAEILKHKEVNHKGKIAWLIETSAIEPYLYEYVLNNLEDFDYVLTHDEAFLMKLGNKGRWYPFGGCWLKSEDQRIYTKSIFNIPSIIASNKQITEGHRLRHEIIRDMPQNLNLYGHGYNPIEYKLPALASYAFSVTIENDRGWFTEKLIDCFRTGTVPIYWGKVGTCRFFDLRGILICNDLESLKSEIKRVEQGGESLYNWMLPYVIKNYHLARQYCIAEDWIFEHYPELFL